MMISVLVELESEELPIQADRSEEFRLNSYQATHTGQQSLPIVGAT